LALLSRKQRIASLSDGGAERVQNARILAFAGDAAKFAIHPLRTATGKLRYAAYAQQLKVTQHRRPDGKQSSQFSIGVH
jgi:hypothetical protein